MQIEERLSSLPTRTRYELNSAKAVHIIPNLGLVQVRGGVSYGLGVLANLGIEPCASIQVPPSGMFTVIAILMGKRSSKTARVSPIGYSLLTDMQDIVTVSISDISRYDGKLINVEATTTRGILNLELDVTTPCNIIYTGWLADEVVGNSVGYRQSNGQIKRLLSRQITKPYIAILSDKDLTDIAKILNNIYFQGRLADISVSWKSCGVASTRIHPMPADTADINMGIKGYKPVMCNISVSRPFLLAQPQLFYEILLHEMIHALGTPDSHNTFFQRWVGIIHGFEPELELATGSYSYGSTGIPDTPKWCHSGEFLVEDNREYTQFICPTCGNVMYAASNNTYRCKCGNSVQFST